MNKREEQQKRRREKETERERRVNMFLFFLFLSKIGLDHSQTKIGWFQTRWFSVV